MRKDPDPAASDSSWHAIVIGTDRYPNLSPGEQLRGCKNDALAMAEFLSERVGVPEENIRLLTSPAESSDKLSSAANIRAALHSLAEGDAVQPGHHVVLFYSGHGLRLFREESAPPRSVFYGLAAADLARNAEGWSSLILDRELNRFLHRMKQRQVSVTVIADTCHAGASTRDVEDRVRVRTLRDVRPLRDEDWQGLLRTHPAFLPKTAPAGDCQVAGSGADRLGRGLPAGSDFVVLAACQDTETAKEAEEIFHGAEGREARRVHGVLTLSLLQALRQIPTGQIRGLRWMDFYEDLHGSVGRRIAALGATSQRPVLEGDPGRPVFGGRWAPFTPGFMVRSTGDGYQIDGGTLHGLDVGTELAIFPPETVDFEAAAERAVPATIVTATFATSIARIQVREDAGRVRDGSHAQLVRPGSQVEPMSVRSVGLPAALIRAAAPDGKEPRDPIVIIAPGPPARVEVRPWNRELPPGVWSADPSPNQSWRGLRGGWVVLRTEARDTPARSNDPAEPAPEDLIAYLPGAGPDLDLFPDKMERLGRALRLGLLHYARYLRTRDRRGSDEVVGAMLSVKLRVSTALGTPSGDEAGALDAGSIDKTGVLSPEAGVYRVREGQGLFVEVTVRKPTALRLYVGLLACSDDGNVYAVWPAQGESYTFGVGTRTYIGQDRFNPLFLNCRSDQKISYWTLKLIAYTALAESTPINIQSFAQPESVQELFAETLRHGRSLGRRPAQPTEWPAGQIWDFRIACEKAESE